MTENVAEFVATTIAQESKSLGISLDAAATQHVNQCVMSIVADAEHCGMEPTEAFVTNVASRVLETYERATRHAAQKAEEAVSAMRRAILGC